MLRAVPALALVPLVILWFGLGETAKLFIVVITVVFPVYLNTFYGVRSVDPQLIEMARRVRRARVRALPRGDFARRHAGRFWSASASRSASPGS